VEILFRPMLTFAYAGARFVSQRKRVSKTAAAFASLRLGENRRLNKEAHFSQRRRHLILKDHIYGA
jgi:hypothetical protein